MNRLLLLSLLTVSVVTEAVAETSSVEWKAQWIWQEEDGPPNSWVAFRKEFDLKKAPEKVTANISADSKYWLWINGKLVVFEGSVARGPSQYRPWKRPPEVWTRPPEEKPANTWYEEVDLSGHLKPGKNTLAVLVWYWGRETHKGTHIDSGKGGFLFQADLGDKLLVSDTSWKVEADSAYALDSGDVGKSIVQYNVKYDARNELGDWTAAEFADEAWGAATEKGVPPAAPWFRLEKNYVPALVNHGLQDYVNQPQATFPFVSDGEAIRCRLPFNKQVTPYLEVECEAGKVIEIGTDNPHNVINAYYTTKKGRQAFESFSWMSGHEVIYQIPAGVKVLGLKYRWMSVGEMAGSFECSDPFYQRLWWMGRNTLFACARDNFMDCPDRERACWIGDVADQSSYLFYCMDEAGRRLLKKAIRVTMAYSQEGVYAALGPLRLRELPSQSLQFVDQCIWQYYLNTGDEQTLRYAYPYVRDYLGLWEMDQNGLPKYRRRGSQDSWDWSDWGQEGTLDAQVLQPALYFMALTSARKMAETLGETEDIGWYEQRIDSMRRSFDQRFWTGSFYSSNPKKFQDDRANCLAILSGLASEQKHDTIAKSVLIPNYYCSPHFEWMVEEALCRAGMPEAALKRMADRYREQVSREKLTTLYEKFPNGGTYNHAWNAPNAILSRYIAGIRPVKPGWKEFEVLPEMSHLQQIRTLVPSVKGDIEIELQRQDKAFKAEIKSPPGAVAIFGIPKSIGELVEVRINDEVVWSDGAISQKSVAIESAGEDARFIKFRIKSGSWAISARAR